MDFQWYTSIGGIVMATIVLVEIMKRFLGNVPYFSAVPTWVYAVVVSVELTAMSHMWWQTLPGDDLDLFMRGAMTAALASGVKEWVANGTKPMSASQAARTQRGE